MKNLKISKKKQCDSEYFGVLHLTDLHFGEGIDLPHNKYNWKVAGKRLKKYIDESCRFFDSYGVKKVFVAMTGDFINSSRRLDELLTNVENSANTVIGAFDILRQALDDLNEKYQLSIAACYGNESRLDKEFIMSKSVVSNNFDSTLYKMLKAYYSGSDVKFVKEGLEFIVCCNSVNILLVHGYGFEKNLEAAVSKLRAKYAAQGVMIDYVLSGHIHSPYMNMLWSRGGSLSGDNAYSFNELQLVGRASQSAVVFGKNKERNGIIFDLCEPNCEGYSISPELQNNRSDEQKNAVVCVDM
ncbi:MAG: hypothetical protein NC124_02195 [Clostridium sp.]|nr:hypothetical protein [Clostridium sp.]